MFELAAAAVARRRWRRWGRRGGHLSDSSQVQKQSSPSLMSVDSRMLVQWREGKFSHGGVMSLGGWGWLVSFSRKKISGISIRRRSWRGRAVGGGVGGGEGGGAGEAELLRGRPAREVNHPDAERQKCFFKKGGGAKSASGRLVGQSR